MKISLYTTIILLTISSLAFAQSLKDSTDLYNGKISVAFGEQTKLEVTSSVYSVSGDELSKRPVLSTSEILIGRIPGLTTRQVTSAPGNSVQLFLRGRNTYRTGTENGMPGNAPLVLIDGFKGDINNISANEIASVVVLKDAAALALYGTDGANGAICITTKRGEIGGLTIGVKVQQGVMQPTIKPELLNAQEYATLYNEALQNDGLEPVYRNISKYGTSSGPLAYLYPDNDYWDLMLNDVAPFTTASINISGGSDKIRYYVSGSYLHNGGLLKYVVSNDKYTSQLKEDRFNIRANVDADITNEFSVKVDFSAKLGKINMPGVGVGDIFNALKNTPPLAFPLLNPDGTYGGNEIWKNNPRAMVESTGYTKNLDRNIMATLKLRYDFSEHVEGLSAGAAVNVMANSLISDAKHKQYATVSLLGMNEADGSYVYDVPQGKNTDLAWNGAAANVFQRYTYDADIRYDKNLGRHALDALLFWRGEQDALPTDWYKPRRLNAGIRLHYGYDNRFFAEFTNSYFGSEQFSRGHRFGFFPAGAFAWVASNENFMRNFDAVDFMKVRASYGLTGGSSLPLISGGGLLYNNRIFFHDAYVNDHQIFFGDQTQGVMTMKQKFLINPDFTWEKSYKADLSIEMSLFNHLDIMLDGFYDRRTDIYSLDKYMPAIMGMNLGDRQKRGNGGEVHNAGFEAVLGVHGGQDFKYNITGAFWYARNKIVKMPDAQIYTSNDASMIGKPVGQVRGHVTNGFFPAGMEMGISENPFQSFGYVGPGDVRYVDLTGDNIVDQNDIKALGYPDLPECSYSLQLDLCYKGLYFSVMGQGAFNSSVMINNMLPFTNAANTYRIAGDRWTEDTASSALFPRLSTTLNENNNRTSDIFLRSTAYFKLRDIEIGYNIPEKCLDKFFDGNIKVFFRGNNLFTISANNMRFIDPESMSSGYPVMRMYSFGLDLQF